MTSDAGMTFEEGNGGTDDRGDTAGVDKVKSVSKTRSKSKSTSAKDVLANINPDAKSLGNTDRNTCRKNVNDVVMFGEDLFKLLSKASSEKEGWMKSTKAMDVGTGCVIQVTTQQRTAQGYVIAEAVTFVPNVKIYETIEKGKVTGRVLKGKR